MAVNGTEFAVPAQVTSGDITTQPSIDLAEYQIWFGTYIDPIMISMFVDSRDKPVNPATPSAAFGRQSILLRRNKELGLYFTINEGSGDFLNTVGTFTDLTPGPGQ